jgi:hypothetical protein
VVTTLFIKLAITVSCAHGPPLSVLRNSLLNIYAPVGFEVIIADTKKNVIFCDVMSSSSLEVHRRFRDQYSLPFSGSKNKPRNQLARMAVISQRYECYYVGRRRRVKESVRNSGYVTINGKTISEKWIGKIRKEAVMN